jgi:hypothetical protein
MEEIQNNVDLGMQSVRALLESFLHTA